jgi:peptide/nickel transport system permease protein
VRLIPGSVIDLMLANNPLAMDKDRGGDRGRARPRQARCTSSSFTGQGGIAAATLGRRSWQDTPVTHEILARLPVTLELALLAMVVSILVGYQSACIRRSARILPATT